MSDGPRVLVVDDEIQIRRFLKISLEANGYRLGPEVFGVNYGNMIREGQHLRG